VSHGHDADTKALSRGDAAVLMRRATYASVAVASLLILGKGAAWLASDSVAMLSTLVDSLLDALASLVTLFAVRTALSPADADHRFGHGKAEPLASLAQAAFVAGTATFVLAEAARHLWQPRPIGHSDLAIGVMVVSILATLGLVLFQRFVVARTGSLAIRGDLLHYASDLLTNAGVLAAIVAVGWTGLLWLDPVAGAAVALFLLVQAGRIAHAALDMLMDRELPEAERARIIEIARAHPEVRDIHDLRTRAAGPDRFIQCHMTLDADLPLRQAHMVAAAVSREIRDAFPDAEVIIHQDPAGIHDPL